MTNSASEPLRLGEARPFVWSSDLDRTCSFFRDQLSFEVSFQYGDPAFYAEVERDGVRLALRHVDRDVIEQQLEYRHKEELLATLIHVTDIDELFQELAASDVPFFQTLRTEAWGGRTFIVEDPDGNLIGFVS